MGVNYLHVENLRNIRQVDLELGDAVNLFVGANGAGKTSLLEAVHFLARARSFQNVRNERLRRHGQQRLLVRATVARGKDVHRVVMYRDGKQSGARLDGVELRSLSEVARLFPLQVLTTECQRLLTDGPDARRSLMNWGVFHVEHGYRDEWRGYHRALRQRNAALRSGDSRLATAWEPEMAERARRIDEGRQVYLERLLPLARQRWAKWLDAQDIEARYRRGWATGTELLEVLRDSREREMDLGYSLYGPHRADLRLYAAGIEATGVLSRGQQKLAVIALRLAECELHAAASGHTPLLLVDDLAAELDSTYRAAVLEDMLAVKAQRFFTAIDADSLPLPADLTRVFHVEQGACRE
jgi:DNA replication and repair protein RecF